MQSVAGRKCIGRLPGLYLERLGKHGGDIAPCARHSGASPLGVEPPWLPGSVFGLSLSWIIIFSDLFYGQRTHTIASVKTVPEAQCENGVRGGAAARGFVRFLGWGIGLSDLS